jgi:AraC-like DNA-binding protein
VGPAIWPHFDLLFVHSGEISIEINASEPIAVRRGQGVLIFPETSFCGESIAEKTKASIHHFDIGKPAAASSQSILQKYSGKKRGFEFLDTAGNSLIDRDLDRSLRLSEQAYSEMTQAMQCNLLCLALAQLQSRNKPVGSASARKTRLRLHKLVAWLSENLAASISVDEMAVKVALSGSHLRRVFRAEFGVGPSQYFQELRMREARRMLRESALPIKAISSQMGFNDLAHFYRSFRKHTEMAPADYRDRNCPIG